MFVQVHHRAIATGGSLRLTNLQPMVRRILHITNLDRLIAIDTADADADGKDSVRPTRNRRGGGRVSLHLTVVISRG